MSGITTRYLFCDLLNGWSNIQGFRRKKWIPVTPESSRSRKAWSVFANGIKHTLTILAYIVVTVATGIFSLIALPFRCALYPYFLRKTIREDLKLLGGKDRVEELLEEIKAYIASKPELKSLFDQLKRKEQTQMIRHVGATYARCHHFYGPIAAQWVDKLLLEAQKEDKRLVFLARDGTGPFKLAKNLMQQYPNRYNGIKPPVLLYLSRKVVAECYRENTKKKKYSKEEKAEGWQKFRDYIKEQGIEEGAKCMFIDVGFAGSMAPKIVDMVNSPLPGKGAETQPDQPITVQFEFLISTKTHQKTKGHDVIVTGFIGTPKNKLKAIPDGNMNPAVNWLEETHQGVLSSPSELVKLNAVEATLRARSAHKDWDEAKIQSKLAKLQVPGEVAGTYQTIHPVTKQPGIKESCLPRVANRKKLLNYLARKWGMRAVERSFSKEMMENIHSPDQKVQHQHYVSKRRAMNKMLLEIVRGRRLILTADTD